MILVDSNIPMYLVGAAHPNKVQAQLTVEQLIAAGERLVTDAEVYQEILHRYVAVNRREAIQPAFDVLDRIVDEVLPVERADLERAKAVVLGRARLSARDALHLALMERHRIETVFSFDAGFDGFPGIRRIPEGEREG